MSAVSDVADKIRSFLHFSVPDEGPLTDYESWMPDFMGGLARGIERSRGLVRKAVEGVAGDMVVSPKLADMQAVQAQGASLEGNPSCTTLPRESSAEPIPDTIPRKASTADCLKFPATETTRFLRIFLLRCRESGLGFRRRLRGLGS